MRKQSGFTLIEVLIALAITAIASMIAYSGLDSAIRMSEGSQEEADRLQAMNRTISIITRDFRQVVPRAVRDPNGSDFEDAFFLDETADPMIRFSRNGWTNPQPERFQRSQLQRVNYHFVDNKLIRYSWQMMDRYEDSEVQEFVLLDNIESFKVRVMSTSTKVTAGKVDISGFEWRDEWPPQSDSFRSGSEILPLAVEVFIEVEGWGKIRRVFQLVNNDI